MAEENHIGMFLKGMKNSMKKYFALMFVLLILVSSLLSSCDNGGKEISLQASEDASTSEISNIESESSVSPTETNSITNMEKLENADGVISVTEQTLSDAAKDAVAYKVLYESENGRLAADVVLPKDYTSKNYPVLIYFPQVRTYLNSLAATYALNGIIVIRPYARGYDESEGMRDMGGNKDLADSLKLLEIFDSASFIENSKIFVAGSSEGSILALRLFAEAPENRITGCAVIDIVADLYEFGNARGEGSQNLSKALIGKSYEEAPEEYELRSAVKFSEKLDGPILLMHYLQSTIFPEEQADALYELIKDNPDCSYYKIDALSSDFNGESLQRLLSWINKYD